MNAMSTTEATSEIAPGTKPDWALTRRDRKRLAREAAGRKPRRWPWALVAVAVVVVSGVYLLNPPAPPIAPIATEAPVGELAMQINADERTTVVAKTLEQVVKVTGSLAPNQQAQLSSQVGGRIDSVLVRPGDVVSKGDVLVQIDVESLRIQLEQQKSTADATQAQLALAESQLSRASELNSRNLASDASLESARANVEGLRANLAALEGQVAAANITLGNATVVAPYDGIVSSRSVEPDQLVSTGAPLISVVDLSRMEFEATAPVNVGGRIEVGQRVAVTVDGIEGQSFAGRVERINPIALEGTRTIPVYIGIDNVGGRLRGGMFATGQIVTAEQLAGIAVPVESVRRDDEGANVIKIVDDRAVRQEVQTGEVWDSGRLIGVTSGLEVGDVVITAPLPEIQPGQKLSQVGN